MFKKVAIIFAVLQVAVAQGENQNWDLAVVIDDQIELLLSNGTLIGSTLQQFSKLKALTFDNVRHQFVVSDMDHLNDTIFTVQLTKETDVTPIVEDLPDDVQGLAIDPISDILYWTDSINRTINYVELTDPTHESKILFAFKDDYHNPQDIAIDVCRRYIYWTNSNIYKPTIERARLNGTGHEVLVDFDLHRPAGIALDLKAQRIYWADMREGIYYRVESTNLVGKERQIIYEGTHSKPFGIAVNDDAIYWTDVNNNALWRILKYSDLSQPEKLRSFKEKPMGIVAKNSRITSLPDCANLATAIAEYGDSTTEVFSPAYDLAEEVLECLNGGELVHNMCRCKRGYIGKSCEVSVCHNFCVHGNCYLSVLGFPRCNCPREFRGERCERDVCEGFCLNNGICTIPRSTRTPACICPEGFVGPRCETNAEIANVCTLFCQQKENDILISQNKELICKCEHGSVKESDQNNTAAYLLSPGSADGELSFIESFQDPKLLVLLVLVLVMFVIITVLAISNCSLRRRPRIKKRIIVNKNITPLTYRPQPTSEQCEITIENCCNMNVCETPCFEPSQLRGLQAKKDDKRKLLSNMENGDELY